MKTLLKSFKITLAFCVFFAVFYVLILWLFAQVAGPNKGNAEVVTLNGISGVVLPVPEMAMTLRVLPVVTKGLRIPNIWLNWKPALTPSSFIIPT